MDFLHVVRRNRRSDRGAVVALVALSMVSIVAVIGVVVDGSNAFTQRRQMQNAADAASLAGARALDRLVPGAEQAIWTAVVASAATNGADTSQLTCRLTDEVLVDLGACPQTPTGTASALKLTAAGVRVTVAATHNTSLIRVVGAKTFTARARATGQIEGLRAGPSPFVMCAVGDSDPRALGDGQDVPVLLPDDTINPNAIYANGGPTYELQDPSTVGCGQGSDFKGLSLDPTGSYPVPGLWDLEGGDKGINATKTLIAGNNACRSNAPSGCIVLVPLCHSAFPSTSGKLYCVRFGAFQIVDNDGSSRVSGRLVDGIVVTGGQGGGRPNAGEARLIKLSE